MKVADGVRIIQSYFPGAILTHDVMREYNDVMARRLHTLAVNPPKDMAGLIRDLDSLGIGVRDGKIILFRS